MKKITLYLKDRNRLKRKTRNAYIKRRLIKKRIANANREYNHLRKEIRSNARKLRIDKKTSRIIKAPPHLSLVKNTDETLLFIAKLEQSLKIREPVLVDLHDVTTLSLNGVLVLLSVMMAFKA